MNRRGFSLVELLVALVVFAVGVLAVIQMTLLYIQANAFNNMASQVAVLAQDKMEQLRAYSASDRIDRYSVFDFDYLVSDVANFTTVYDPAAGTGILVDGLLSGGNSGTPTTTPWGVSYEVMYDDGSHGDQTAGDGEYTNEDIRNTVAPTQGLTPGATMQVNRRWTVTPFVVGGARPDMALLGVWAWWTDKFGVDHTIELHSAIHRRQ